MSLWEICSRANLEGQRVYDNADLGLKFHDELPEYYFVPGISRDYLYEKK